MLMQYQTWILFVQNIKVCYLIRHLFITMVNVIIKQCYVVGPLRQRMLRLTCVKKAKIMRGNAKIAIIVRFFSPCSQNLFLSFIKSLRCLFNDFVCL